MNEPAGPTYPLTAIYVDSMSTQFDSEDELVCSLEEHDTDDPEDSSYLVILDADRRRVRLKMEGQMVRHIGLYDDRPITMDELLKLLVQPPVRPERQRFGSCAGNVMMLITLGSLALGVLVIGVFIVGLVAFGWSWWRGW